jgi:hypothetical protein
VGFEFMLLDRPIVVVDCPELLDKARVSQDKAALLRSAAEVVPAEDVAGAVRRGLFHPMRFSAKRRQIASQLFYRPGGASARAVRCVYELLQLSIPDAVSAEPRVAAAPLVRSGFETRTRNHA